MIGTLFVLNFYEKLIGIFVPEFPVLLLASDAMRQ